MPWGAAIGAIGSIAGGLLSSGSNKKAASQAMTGYNYLTGKNGVSGYVNQGNTANNAESQLLGLQPITDQTKNGFNNYLNSTGYNFQLDQGTRAITGSAAARGILNSGATAKALEGYGQNLASTTFNNYLGQVGNVANQGLTASGQIGAAGTQGGATAANATNAGGNSLASGLQTGISGLGNAFGGTLSNIFGAL